MSQKIVGLLLQCHCCLEFLRGYSVLYIDNSTRRYLKFGVQDLVAPEFWEHLILSLRINLQKLFGVRMARDLKLKIWWKGIQPALDRSAFLRIIIPACTFKSMFWNNHVTDLLSLPPPKYTIPYFAMAICNPSKCSYQEKNLSLVITLWWNAFHSSSLPALFFLRPWDLFLFIFPDIKRPLRKVLLNFEV